MLTKLLQSIQSFSMFQKSMMIVSLIIVGTNVAFLQSEVFGGLSQIWWSNIGLGVVGLLMPIVSIAPRSS